MKRTVTKLISLLLVVVILFSTLPTKALAWGKSTHVFTANNIIASTWSGTSSVKYEDSTYNFTIPEEFRQAIQNYPQAFRAGALGPDMYPDILTGQMYIHPADPNIDSGEWITYLCNAVNKMGKDTEGRKVALSFTLGCILHYCGDLFGHDFVNTFSGGAFPSVASAEMLDMESERLNNVLSHLSVEKYMDTLIYPGYSSASGKIDAPNPFVRNVMVFNGTPAAGLAPLYKYYPALELQDIDTGDIWIISDILDNILDGLFDNGTNNVPPHYTAMLALRTYVTARADKYRENMEPASAAITRFYDEWAKDIDKGITKFTECSDNIASRMVTKEKNPLIEQKKEEELKEEKNFFVNQLDEALQKQALKSGITQEQLDWIEEQSTLGIDGNSFVDEILRELIRDGVVTQEMLNKSDGSIMIIKEELGYWWDEYGIYMLGIPDIVIDGVEIPVIGDIIDLILLGPLWDLIVEEIKKLVADEIVEACTGWVGKATGLSNAEVGQRVAALISSMNDRMQDPALQLDHEDNPYKPSENNFEELDEYMQYLASGEYSEFEALHNTLTMFKLVLMGPGNYSNFVQQYASTQQTAYHTNTGHVEVSALNLKIKTSDLYQAGTDDNIYVTVYRVGPDGSKLRLTKKLLDKSGYNDFEAGDEDEYLVELPKSVRLEEIAVSLSKTPAFDFLPSITDDWSCESIVVTPMFSDYYAVESYIHLGGIKLKGIRKDINLNFREALDVKGNENPQSLPVTNLQVTVNVKNDQWAGSDSDIYLVAYYGDVQWAKVCLDKPWDNDLERGETEIYNIPITNIVNPTTVQGIPLNQLRLEIKHEGSDMAKWRTVEVMPCYGAIPLLEEVIIFSGKNFEKTTWSLAVQKQLKKATYAAYPAIEYEYVTNLDDGLLFFMDSLDGGEEWMDPQNEMWSNTTIRKDIFLRLFKGFTPEIEYTGKNEFLKGATPVISLDFAGQWNGVSMERRTEVKDFQHKEPVEGSAIIELFNEKNKCVYKADNVSVIDGKLEHTVSDTGRMTTGMYDVQVTYLPDPENPLYGETEEIFEDAFKYEVGPLTITKQPQDVERFVGEKVEFFIEATGGMRPYTYQWQYKKGNGEWQDPDASWSVGYNYTPFGFLAHEDEFTTGYQYRCIITDDAGTSVSSDVVKVLEAAPLTITKQPQNVTSHIGLKVSFTVEVAGGRSPISYQWQFNAGNNKWYDAENTTTSSGCNTNAFTITVSDDEFSSNYEYRCVITDKRGNSVTSDVVKVLEAPPLEITKQPVDVTVPAGQKANVSVGVKGGVAPYTYVWQLIRNGAWSPVPNINNYSGLGTNSLTLVTNNVGAVTLRCWIQDAAGKTIESKEATITTTEPPLSASITPTNVPIDLLGKTAHFTVMAIGGHGPYTYNWKTLANIGAKKTWVDVEDSRVVKGQGTNTLSCTPNQVKTYEYYCIVTDSAGNTVQTETVSVIVKPLEVKINDGAEKYTISYIKDESIVLKANATGGLGPYTCIWYEIGFDESKLDYDWIPVHTGPTYEVGPWFSHEIRLEVTDAKGNTAKTSVWIEVTDQIN